MPANEIVGLLPGELFVHRNIANVVVHSDLNCLSVMQFAVDVLKVEHIIVCGHYGCSGVSAALQNQRVGLADNWLRHVQDVHAKHDARVDAIADMPKRVDRLCELNVIEQVANVGQTTIVQDAWSRGQELAVHGWVYGLDDGLVRDLAHDRLESGRSLGDLPRGVGRAVTPLRSAQCGRDASRDPSARGRLESRRLDRRDDGCGSDGSASYSTVAAFFSSDTSTPCTPDTCETARVTLLHAASAVHADDGEFVLDDVAHGLSSLTTAAIAGDRAPARGRRRA